MIQRFRTIYRWLGPAWLAAKGDGEKNLHSIGVICDAFAERCRLSLLAKFPDYAESDTLDLIGRDRGITRGINEAAESYAPRLKRWLDDLQTIGNAYTLIEQLRAYIQVPCKIQTIDNSGNRYEIAADGTRTFTKGTWNWDGNTSQWSRFWVIIYQNESPSQWAPYETLGQLSEDLGELSTGLGGTMTPDQAKQIRNIVQTWKPAGTAAWWVIVSFDGVALVPDGNWAQWHKTVTGDSVASRYDGARYFHVTGLLG